MDIFKEIGVREDKDRVNEEVIYTVARAYIYLDKVISSFLLKYNLTPAKFNILLMVKHKGADKGISQKKISSLLLVTTSNITHMVDKLQKEGYVDRLAQKGDRRVNLIKITKKGSDILDRIWPHYKKMVDELVNSCFSDVEKKMINKLLQRIDK